jgi:hypothetical protein
MQYTGSSFKAGQGKKNDFKKNEENKPALLLQPLLSC